MKLDPVPVVIPGMSADDAYAEVADNGLPIIRTADDAPFAEVTARDLRDDLEAARDEGLRDFLS